MALTKRLAHEWNLTVDPEFKSLLAEHSQEERALFEDSLLNEGCRDAVVVWAKGDKRIIVDGHHRFDTNARSWRWCSNRSSRRGGDRARGTTSHRIL